MQRKGNLIGQEGYCFQCGNKGFPDKVCPSCKREPTKKSMNYEFKDDVDRFVEKIDAFGIPGKYRGVIWNKDVLLHDKAGKYKDHNFEHFVDQLDKINSLFASGTLSAKSAIIVAPAGFSKMVFTYSCMQRAIDHGFSVAPLLDTIELKRLLFLASERPNYRLYGKIDFDEYLMSDVCFVTVTKLSQRAWAYETIQEIIDLRARKELSTFIVSRFDLTEISQRDVSNSFDAIRSIDVQDTYKYPAVIRYSVKGQ